MTREAQLAPRGVMRTARHGIAAGLWGVAGMAGAITTLRRALVPPDEDITTHPEMVVERLKRAIGFEGDLDPMTRRRLADVLHFGFGATWGMVYAVTTRGRHVDPLVGGAAAGSLLWLTAFWGYMPALGVQPGAWTWDKREHLLTGTAHVVYGMTMATILQSLESRGAIDGEAGQHLGMSAHNNHSDFNLILGERLV